MLRFTLTTATIVLILMAVLVPFTKEPPVEAQTINTFLEQKTVINEVALQEQIDRTNKALDKVCVSKKVKTIVKSPKKEVIYFRKDGEVFEKEFTRQDGMLIIDLDSVLLWGGDDSDTPAINPLPFETSNVLINYSPADIIFTPTSKVNIITTNFIKNLN